MEKRLSRNKMVLVNPRLKSGVNEKSAARRTASAVSSSIALVICNGEPPTKKLARQLARSAHLIVAADGGANICWQLGLRPDVIIGDLDSVTPATKKFFSSAEIIRVNRQDNTDLEKALDFLVEREILQATIIAATGKRLDHTLGNLSVIWNYTSSIDFSFVGNGWFATPVGKKKKVAAKVGTTVSVLPFGNCAGITLKGLQYPLTNGSMKVGEIGVSNVVTKSPFTVEVKKGKMLMIILARHSSIGILR